MVCVQVWHWALLPPQHAPDVWNGCGHWGHFPASLAGLGMDGQGLCFLLLGPSHFLRIDLDTEVARSSQLTGAWLHKPQTPPPQVWMGVCV